ncbi:MAG TPA: hypothetical protein PLP04_15650, partial [Bryobacteraceae bacterium]|nr:hypothetical protein [Bryobacteraceae bacterium]
AMLHARAVSMSNGVQSLLMPRRSSRSIRSDFTERSEMSPAIQARSARGVTLARAAASLTIHRSTSQ